MLLVITTDLWELEREGASVVDIGQVPSLSYNVLMQERLQFHVYLTKPLTVGTCDSCSRNMPRAPLIEWQAGKGKVDRRSTDLCRPTILFNDDLRQKEHDGA